MRQYKKTSDSNPKPDPYPMLLSPAFKDYLWGGNRLIDEYKKNTDLRPVAESWELSCHPDGLCKVESGDLKGRILADLLDEYPEWIGSGATGARDFPILIKFIDAKQDLSLQVHPGDAYARANENDNGKNEAWYVLDREPGATLILGLKTNAPPDKIQSLLAGGAILDYVNTIPVEPGDCYCVPAGLLHAIGGGILVAEVQQSSNVTYRVYDYGRVGVDGKPRQLHTKRAAAVIDGTLRAYNNKDAASIRQFRGYSVADLVDWPYFKLSQLDIDGEARLECGCEAFHALLITEGEFTVDYYDAPSTGENTAGEQAWQARKGACVFVPAGLGSYSLRGKGRVLLATV